MHLIFFAVAKNTGELIVSHLIRRKMFEINKKYKHREIKEYFGIEKGSAILEAGKPKKFVALCLTRGYDFISPNMALIKNGPLIRKIGRALAGVKYPVKLFLKNDGEFEYQYVGEVKIIESKTAPRKVKTRTENKTSIRPKELSRIIYLNMPKNG